MTREDLDLVVAHTRHGRYRELTADDHPDRDYYRDAVRRKAAELRGGAEPPLPSLAAQALGLAGAAGRVVGAAVSGSPVLAPLDVQEARLAVCRQGAGLPGDQVKEGHCDRYRTSDGRCAACGCRMAGVAGKARLATERCPLGRWPEG